MARSIASIAEELLLQDMGKIQEGSLSSPNVEAPHVNPEPEQRDITGVTVTNDFMKQILGESVIPEMDIADIPEKPFDFMAEKETVNPEAAPEDLLAQFNELLQDAKRVLSEMTSAGMLGVNMAGSSKQKNTEKDNPWAICHDSTGKKKTAKVERCVKHIKAKSNKK